MKYLILVILLLAKTSYAGVNPVLDLSTLNGSNGFVVYGTNQSFSAGDGVSAAGDINDDGIDDFIISANRSNNFAGVVYVVFGSIDGYWGELQLTDIDGSNGFIIHGLEQQDVLGSSIAGVGDINNDGIDDIAIGARTANNGSGTAYFIFGKNSGFSSSVDLSLLDGNDGFSLNSLPNTGGWLGYSVASAGDFNNDGINDVLISANLLQVDNIRKGAVYILFGSNSFDALMTTDELVGSVGKIIYGELENGQLGDSLSSSGDINGDGFDDIIIGEYLANGIEENIYVIFGDNTGFPDVFNVSSLDGSNGFKITAGTVDNYFGKSIAADFDINMDGFSDILIGAPNSNGPVNAYAGGAYVVFGQANFSEDTFNINALDGSNGFVIGGEVEGFNDLIQLGFAVSSIGDFNSDGIDDIAFSTWGAGSFFQGSTYVLYGSTDSFTANFDVNSLNGENGFSIHGIDTTDHIGESLSRAGDINNDGAEDFLIAAPNESTNSVSSGAVYAIFGKLQSQSLFITKTGDGSGVVTSDSGDINCGEICSDDYPTNSMVTLNAVADNNSMFTGWSGAECSGTSDCVVTIDQAQTINAEFMDNTQFNLSITKTGDGTGVIVSDIGNINCGAICSDDYPINTMVTLTVVVDENMSFIGWSGSGCVGTNDCVVTMSQARTVVAEIWDNTEYNLSILKSGNGSGLVTDNQSAINCGEDCNGSYLINAIVTISATPDINMVFIGWSGAGCTGTNDCMVTMDQAQEVTATFVNPDIIFINDFE